MTTKNKETLDKVGAIFLILVLFAIIYFSFAKVIEYDNRLPEYKVITSKYASELEMIVTDKIAEGYRVDGEMLVVVDEDSFSGLKYVQVMTR